ncbi:DUF934 domain-containing protein [Pseudoduganella namucuonensis]|uniref:Uncharacterized conserved protein, DUF934 family n=1 Tax=Pseudoduganella namucuonensis TaxID=1035707 RepID=A0A1I7LYN0_9BURK|nr:DUF934 domain-containing protein [Pseudoduganella namucuonensis]SFV14769.1 Uncharacterized conserved protein, DUF934 family [Pseudoduganella namucuonensis]
MSKIIKNREIVADDWTVLRAEEGQDAAALAIPAGKVIVPLAAWLAQGEALAARAAAGEIGVWIASDERPETLKGQFDQFALVAVDFPKFTDGRGYSIAYNLRMRLGYTGELRAIGDVLRDQLFSMQRVGFNAFATRPDRSIEDALKGLSDFSETYSASVDQKAPLFRRHVRVGGHAETGDVGFGI